MKIFKFFSKNFTSRNTNANVNKFADLNKDIKFVNQKVNMETYKDKLGQVRLKFIR
jgi:hypothetical protein